MVSPVRLPSLPLSPKGFGLSALGEGKSFLFPASAPAHTTESPVRFLDPGIPWAPILVTQLPIRCRDRGQCAVEAPGGDAEYLWGRSVKCVKHTVWRREACWPWAQVRGSAFWVSRHEASTETALSYPHRERGNSDKYLFIQQWVQIRMMVGFPGGERIESQDETLYG